MADEQNLMPGLFGNGGTQGISSKATNSIQAMNAAGEKLVGQLNKAAKLVSQMKKDSEAIAKNMSSVKAANLGNLNGGLAKMSGTGTGLQPTMQNSGSGINVFKQNQSMAKMASAASDATLAATKRAATGYSDSGGGGGIGSFTGKIPAAIGAIAGGLASQVIDAYHPDTVLAMSDIASQLRINQPGKFSNQQQAMMQFGRQGGRDPLDAMSWAQLNTQYNLTGANLQKYNDSSKYATLLNPGMSRADAVKGVAGFQNVSALWSMRMLGINARDPITGKMQSPEDIARQLVSKGLGGNKAKWNKMTSAQRLDALQTSLASGGLTNNALNAIYGGDEQAKQVAISMMKADARTGKAADKVTAADIDKMTNTDDYKSGPSSALYKGVESKYEGYAKMADEATTVYQKTMEGIATLNDAVIKNTVALAGLTKILDAKVVGTAWQNWKNETSPPNSGGDGGAGGIIDSIIGALIGGGLTAVGRKIIDKVRNRGGGGDGGDGGGGKRGGGKGGGGKGGGGKGGDGKSRVPKPRVSGDAVKDAAKDASKAAKDEGIAGKILNGLKNVGKGAATAGKVGKIIPGIGLAIDTITFGSSERTTEDFFSGKNTNQSMFDVITSGFSPGGAVGIAKGAIENPNQAKPPLQAADDAMRQGIADALKDDPHMFDDANWWLSHPVGPTPDSPLSPKGKAQKKNVTDIFKQLAGSKNSSLWSDGGNQNPNSHSGYNGPRGSSQMHDGQGGPTANNHSSTGLIAEALKWLGTPYSWGGGNTSGPTYGISQGRKTKGFDCSSFVQYVFAKFGVNLPRTSQQQARSGKEVPRAQARTGDLLLFSFSGPNDHVAIYLGGNKMIEAPKTGDVVKVAGVPWGSVSHIRRVIGANLVGSYNGESAGGTSASGGGTGTDVSLPPGTRAGSVFDGHPPLIFGKYASDSSSGVGMSDSTAATTLAGGATNGAKVFNTLVRKGFTAEAAAGVIGNLMQESGVDPTRNQAGGGAGRGIAQWSVGQRWEDEQRWARANKVDPMSLDGQTAFMIHEMQQRGQWNPLAQMKDVHLATKYFSDKYEVPGDAQMDKRFSFADAAYKQFGSKKGYSEGAWRVNRDQTANIHEGEMILSRPIADVLRGAISDGFKGNTSGASPIVVNMTVNFDGMADQRQAVALVKTFKDTVEKVQSLNRIRKR